MLVMFTRVVLGEPRVTVPEVKVLLTLVVVALKRAKLAALTTSEITPTARSSWSSA